MSQSFAKTKSAIESVGKICLVLALGISAAFPQTSNPVLPSAKSKSAPEVKSKNPWPEAEELREQQLRVFREHILTRTLDQIKKTNEPGLRLSARNQVLAYLSESKAPSEDDKLVATKLALEALTDFSEHSEDILPFMANYLLSDLGAWIQKYRPELKERLEAVVKGNKNSRDVSRIRALFELKNGDVLAVKQIHQLLRDGRELDGLFFWLEELRKRKSQGFEPLLSEIVSMAERGSLLSLDTLFWIKPIYLSAETPLELQRRFLRMVVSRTQANVGVEPVSQRAYELLSSLLPVYQQVLPELYEQAASQSFIMQAALTESEKAIAARTKRLQQSLNPIEDLLTEADAAKTKTERNDLLVEAAQLALRTKKFAFCLDIVDKVDLSIAAMTPGFWAEWKDQLLKKFVVDVLATKDTELALKASSRVSSTLVRVETLALITRYWVSVNQKVAAQQVLTEASRIAGAGSNDIEKAKAFFLLSLTCDPVDESKKAELLQSGIKALNNVFEPNSKADNKEPYQQYVRVLDNTGYQLTKAFKQLIKKDENRALALIEEVQKHDLKAFALIGILSGLDDLLATAAGTRQGASVTP